MNALVKIFESRGAAVQGVCLHNGGGRAHITKGHGHGGSRVAGVSSKHAQEKPIDTLTPLVLLCTGVLSKLELVTDGNP